MTLLVKFCGMALLVYCTTSLGLSAAAGLGRRVRELELSLAVVAGLAGELQYSLAPPSQAVERLAARPSLGRMGYLGDCASLCRQGTPFPRAWKTALGRARGALLPEDLGPLAELGETLGQCDLAGQLASLDRADRLLRCQLEEARAQRLGRGKLYRTMGVLSGVFLAILFV